MPRTFSPKAWVLLLLLCLHLKPAISFAGTSQLSYNNTDTVSPIAKSNYQDSLSRSRNFANTDTVFSIIKNRKDSLSNSIHLAKKSATTTGKNFVASEVKKINKPFFAIKKSKKKIALDSIPTIKLSEQHKDLTKLFSTKPLVKFNGGFVNYNALYRAGIDTPYQQKDILQQTVNGQLNITVASKYPVKFSWLARKSNSTYFRDIYDVRGEFDGVAFRNGLLNSARQSFTSLLDNYRDSLTGKLYQSKLAELNDLKSRVESPFERQRLVEMNEVLRIPALSYDASLPDSTARRLSDSAIATAAQFVKTYHQYNAAIAKLQHSVDSLKEKFYQASIRIQQFKQMLNGRQQDWSSIRDMKQSIAEMTGAPVAIPKKLQWLMGVRNMSVGRNQLNYSELTAKNISVNGFNFEYNSWYYFAVSAGLVDYRFRDFALRPQKRSPQHMYLLRLGVGQLEKNYFILSYFAGRKQLYTTASAGRGVGLVSVKGLSAEAKWQMARNSFVVAEAAQSSSPDLSGINFSENKFWDLSNTENKAFSIKLYSYLPKTRSRVEAQYKFTGANYQSFTSFQTNTANTAWFVKAEQNLFNRQLKLAASLRSNEFSSPYIVQAYSSNTVFKSLQLTFRKRRWPMMSVGYLPASQLVKLDNQLLETRFQSLNASISHIYKIGLVRASTTLVFNRFYNASSDSGFVYFNAVNTVLAHNFFFQGFTANLNVMSTKNTSSELNVLEAGAQFPFNNRASFGGGAKVNNINRSELRIGYYANAQLKLFRQDMLHFSYEKGYLAGSGNNLIRNDFLTISFSKFF